jgi:hypothetical protein
MAKNTYQKNPNPQGKGAVQVLSDWTAMRPIALAPKSSTDFLRDYCVSSLVLAADFRFKPVVGKTYYLYVKDGEWSLTMISPSEWGERKAGQYLASCQLRPDMTWTMNAADLADQPETLAQARNFIQGFVDALSEQDTIAENLPFFVQEMPYYRRMLATALSSSLKRTLPPTGDDMQALLNSQNGVMLLS